ncbi:hypothetical protein ACJJTC_009755 [Scirpophaga incertulas]
MTENKNHFRHHLLFAFNRGAKATEAAREICADASRSGRPSEFDEERLDQLLHEDARQTTRELAERIGSNKSTVAEHLHSMGKVQKLGAWVSNVLSENNKNQRSTIAASLLARHLSTHGHKQRFLYRIVTGDEKWCLYVNMKLLLYV